MKKVLTIFGTRPEAIKLAPVIVELKRRSDVCLRTCVTAQHRQMLDQVLGLFGIVPDIDLDLMQPDQTLAELTARVMIQGDQVLREEAPDMLIVQGDTTTVMAASMAAFYRGVKVAHVEAGLRTGDISSPFPEEMNRRVTTIFSVLHFAPTERAVHALLQEGIPEDRIFLTGNPVVDALQMTLQRPVPAGAETLLTNAGVNGTGGTRRLILVTAHRRENFGARFESLCHGIKSLAERNPDTSFIYPVHLNPNVQEPVFRILGNTERVFLTAPVEYDVLAHLMKASYLILTDSGGVQEEAPSLGKPVLVMRSETERPEGIEAGTAKLVGTDAERIVTETETLLRDTEAYHRMSKAVNPYGDGKAAKRIADILLSEM